MTGPYRSVPAASLASRLDALVTNTHFLPSTCVAARFEGVHFGLGASIAVRGEALARGGRLRGAARRSPPTTTGSRAASRPPATALAWTPLMVEHVLEDDGWRRVAAPPAPLGARRAQLAARSATSASSRCSAPLPALLLAALWRPGRARLALPLAWWGAQLAHVWRAAPCSDLAPGDLALLPAADLLAALVWAGGFVGSPEPPEAEIGSPG